MFYERNSQVREQLAPHAMSIVGCGSFGSALADMLVRAGVERLTLIDPETLSVENVGRHILTADDAGRFKAEALAGHLLRINPAARIEVRPEPFRPAAAEGLLLCCADSRRCESLVNAVALEKQLRTVYLGAYGAARAAEVQFFVPGQTPCRECFARFRNHEPPAADRRRYTDPDFDDTRTPAQTGLWGSVLAACGIAFHGILAMLGIRGALDLARPLWIVNLDYAGFQPYAVTFAKIARGCAVCDETMVEELRVEEAS